MRALLYAVGKTVCHQLPERTIITGGMPLPFCARCTGIYAGFLISCLYLLANRRASADMPPAAPAAVLSALAVTPMIVDGLSSYLGVRVSGNLVRILTGAPFGCVLPVFLILVRNYDINGDNSRSIVKPAELLLLLFFSLASSAAIYFHILNNWEVAGVLICLSYMLLIYNIILTIILIFKRCFHGFFK